MGSSAQGIVFTFGSTTVGKISNINMTESYTDLDETDLDNTRENHQAGIIMVTGTIDCYGPEVEGILGQSGAVALSGTRAKSYGDCVCLSVTAGASVKGLHTTQYSFSSTVIET